MSELVRLSRPPDGRIMCCLCFELFEVKDLAVDACGDKIDVCLTCQILEQAAALKDTFASICDDRCLPDCPGRGNV